MIRMMVDCTLSLCENDLVLVDVISSCRWRDFNFFLIYKLKIICQNLIFICCRSTLDLLRIRGFNILDLDMLDVIILELIVSWFLPELIILRLRILLRKCLVYQQLLLMVYTLSLRFIIPN